MQCNSIVSGIVHACQTKGHHHIWWWNKAGFWTYSGVLATTVVRSNQPVACRVVIILSQVVTQLWQPAGIVKSAMFHIPLTIFFILSPPSSLLHIPLFNCLSSFLLHPPCLPHPLPPLCSTSSHFCLTSPIFSSLPNTFPLPYPQHPTTLWSLYGGNEVWGVGNADLPTNMSGTLAAS